jgi:glutaminyl-peptide cyclotransferase
MKIDQRLLRFKRVISVVLGIAVFLTACASLPVATPPQTFVSNISPIATLPVQNLTPRPVPVYTFTVVNSYPHDRAAFTEGLVMDNGVLYESTGLNGQSGLRRVDLASGTVLQNLALGPEYFGEGATVWHDQIIQLTWKSHIGFVYDKASFKLIKSFDYPTEGWGLTHDDTQLIMSDGTSTLRLLDPNTFQATGYVTVTAGGQPVVNLNELEYVRDEIWANVWQTDRIARIAPATGQVIGWIDLSGLLRPADRQSGVDVLNGIAYDAEHDRLFVTGKLWPKLFEITVMPRP